MNLAQSTADYAQNVICTEVKSSNREVRTDILNEVGLEARYHLESDHNKDRIEAFKTECILHILTHQDNGHDQEDPLVHRLILRANQVAHLAPEEGEAVVHDKGL